MVLLCLQLLLLFVLALLFHANRDLPDYSGPRQTDIVETLKRVFAVSGVAEKLPAKAYYFLKSPTWHWTVFCIVCYCRFQ